jgi:hypothetical protein
MSERKPAGRTFESWIEELIERERAAGGFDSLRGHGQPIPGLATPYDPLWWIKQLLERETLSTLPPALEVRAKVAKSLEALQRLRTEDEVRAQVAAINAEIARANRTVAEGPPTSLSPLDVEEVLARWRRRDG